jgi:hypothetical protein
MRTNKKTQQRLKLSIPVMTLGTLAIAASFSLGIKTASDVETVAPMHASGIETRITGDINDDGRVDVRDAIAVLEVVRGYRTATPDELLADPNGDGKLTIDDAMRILSDLPTR